MQTSNDSDVKPTPLTRRIVTGHDDNGKSKVLYDDTKGHIVAFDSGTRFQTLWFTDNVPADCLGDTSEDPTGNVTFQVINDGSVCNIVCMAPGSTSPMHRTKSIDYGIVLEGEVELQLETGDKRLLKTGDVIVQRETVHAWRNPQSDGITRIFFVVIASNTPGNKDFQEA